MASVLSAFREAVMAGNVPELDTETETVTIKDPSNQSNTLSWPRKTQLPWRLKSGSFLELDAVALLLKNSQAKLSEYIKMCRTFNIQQIPFSEWPALRAYMGGMVQQSAAIDLKAFAALTQQEDVAEQVEEPNQAITQTYNQPISQSVDSSTGVPQEMSQWSLDDVLKQERLVANRVSFMQGKRPLSVAIELYDNAQKEREHKRVALSKQKAEARKSSSSSTTHSKSSIPIIIVPSSISSTITLYNVKAFLESGRVVTTEDARKATPNKPSKLMIERPSIRDRSRPVVWEVIDDTSRLRSEDWGRVVAVFVAGVEWQFDGWPWTSKDPATNQPKPNPAKIFEHVCPFHVRNENETLNKNVQNWKVHRLTVNPSKSYNDRGQAMEFWQIVTEFVGSRKQFHNLNV